MHRTLVLFSGLLITAFMVSADGAEEAKPSTDAAPATVAAPTVETSDDTAPPQNLPRARITREAAERASEIIELREQLGGSLIAGSVLDAASDEEGAIDERMEFLEVLQVQLGKPSTERCEEAYRNAIEVGETSTGPRPYSQIAPRHIDSARLPDHSRSYAEQDLAAVLRLAGRELDNRANDLEDMGDYGRGDELRRLARRLRRVARETRERESASRRAAELIPGDVFSR